MDEVFLIISGQRQYLWRAVDQDGNVVDILVQSRRNKKAAYRFFCKMLKRQGAPRKIVTDKLRTYRVARKEVIASFMHCQDQYANNRAEHNLSVGCLASRRKSSITPKELIKVWIEKFNSADIVGLANLYAEDAVNDQAVFSEPLVGRAAIRKLFEIDFARATMVCIEERIYECDDTAILQWRDSIGLKGCGFFKVQNDQIVHQKGYFDQLSFFKAQGLPVPADYLDV